MTMSEADKKWFSLSEEEKEWLLMSPQEHIARLDENSRRETVQDAVFQYTVEVIRRMRKAGYADDFIRSIFEDLTDEQYNAIKKAL